MSDYVPNPEIEADVDRLIFESDLSRGSKYHDAESCWQLIEAMRQRLITWVCRDETDIRNTGADIVADLLAEIARSGEHPGAFGGEAMETAALAILEIHRRADRAIANALRVQRKGEAILKEHMTKGSDNVDSSRPE